MHHMCLYRSFAVNAYSRPLHSAGARASSQCSVTMANTNQPEPKAHKKLSEKLRRGANKLGFSFLKHDEKVKALLGTLTSNDVKVGPGNPYKAAPYAQAAEFIASNPLLKEQYGYANVTKKSALSHLRPLCHTWLWADASDPDRQCLQDLPRRTRGQYGLSDADYSYMGDILSTLEWLDSQGNRRHYPGLEAILTASRDLASTADGSPEERHSAQCRVDRLEDIKSRATGRANESLDHVLDYVCDKCGCGPGPDTVPVATLCMHGGHALARLSPPSPCMLHRARIYAHVLAAFIYQGCRLVIKKEVFKCPRENRKAYECARRWRGIEPMLEFFESKHYPAHGARYGAAWQHSVLMSLVPPDPYHEQAWADCGNCIEPSDDRPSVQQQATQLPHFGQGCWPMYLTPSAFDLYFSVDGFTIYDCRGADKMGNYVFVKSGECPPPCTHPDINKNPTSRSVSRQHYLMLIGPPGFCLCVAMKSGTHLWHGKPTDEADKKYKYWWDYIPELLEAADLGGRDPVQVQQEMAGRTWLTQDGKEGQGLVKEEFQAVMQWLMVPYIMKTIRERDPDDTNTLSGKSYSEIISEWTQKFQGCYTCLEHRRWQCSGIAKVTAAMKEAEKADKKAELEHAAAVSCVAPLAAAQSKSDQADVHLTEKLAQLKAGGAAQFQDAFHDADAACDAMKSAKRELWAVQAKLQQHEAASKKAALEAMQWRQTAAQALLPWKPTLIPFLLSWDNCPSYSLYADNKQEILLPIVPIIQLLAIPPHAHDIHQPVEHSIGVCKNHVTSVLNKEDGSLADMSHVAVQQTVLDGAKMFTAVSWQRNMHKLFQCLRLVSTSQDTKITVQKRRRNQASGDAEDNAVKSARRGTDGNYCYKDFS